MMADEADTLSVEPFFGVAIQPFARIAVDLACLRPPELIGGLL